MLNKAFDGRLIFPPIPEPKKILDCGFGTGSWATEVAEQYPECEVQQVIGIDISPHMKPDETPENLWLQLRGFVQKLSRKFERGEPNLPIQHHHDGSMDKAEVATLHYSKADFLHHQGRRPESKLHLQIE
ncbi:MAG: hypothetical protein M1840_002844 [Geoglossum simile]|nr:MAG: hypothetical protein M1840_002844 [Geoglossum simile]